MSRIAMHSQAGSADHSGELVSIFPTEIGWMAIVGQIRPARSTKVVQTILIGHPSAAAARKAAKASTASNSISEQDWHQKLRQSLEGYSKGQRVDFGEFDLNLPERTPFRDQVLAATRRLQYGETTTYGELARRVGHPGAARAVGTVMSTNRFPILIPCHRVLAAGGKLGGYTSPAGTDLKQRLLEMEQAFA